MEKTNIFVILELLGSFIPQVWARKDVSCFESIYTTIDKWGGVGLMLDMAHTPPVTEG